MTPRRILETAPDGSSELLDAVEATFDTVDDAEFLRLLAIERPPQPVDEQTARFETRLRDKLRPWGETHEGAATRIGPKRFYTLPTTHEQERVA